MPLSLLTYHLIDDLVMSQEKLIHTAKLQNFQLQGDCHPWHSNLHRILVCSEHSNGIQFHLLQNKIYSPGPTQPWRQWHPEQKLPWVEITLNFTYYAIPAMPTVFHLLIAVMITDCQPAPTIHMPLLHSSMLQGRTRTNTRPGLCLAKSCI